MVDELEVLSVAAPLPFPIDDRVAVNDEIRLKYRYLDMRRAAAGNALRMRSKVNQIARDVLLERDFVEIETPTLTALDARGRPRLPRAGAPRRRAPGTRCRSRRSCSSSC